MSADDKPTWREAPEHHAPTAEGGDLRPHGQRTMECFSCGRSVPALPRQGRWILDRHTAPCGLPCVASQFIRSAGARTKHGDPSLHCRNTCPRCNPRIAVIHYIKRPEWMLAATQTCSQSEPMTLAEMRTKVRELKAEGWEFEVRDIEGVRIDT